MALSFFYVALWRQFLALWGQCHRPTPGGAVRSLGAVPGARGQGLALSGGWWSTAAWGRLARDAAFVWLQTARRKPEAQGAKVANKHQLQVTNGQTTGALSPRGQSDWAFLLVGSDGSHLGFGLMGQPPPVGLAPGTWFHHPGNYKDEIRDCQLWVWQEEERRTP